jgi:hypothetical protein
MKPAKMFEKFFAGFFDTRLCSLVVLSKCLEKFENFKETYVATAVSRLRLKSPTSMILLFDHMTENTLFLYLLFYVQISIHICYF